jgi:hypothetical protein
MLHFRLQLCIPLTFNYYRDSRATARALAPRAMNDLSTSSVLSATDSDKDEAGYPVGVLLPGETPTRSKGSRDPRRGSSSANTKKGSKVSSSKKGYSAPATTAAPGGKRAKPNVPAAPANPAFAFANNQTKDKFRPGWAV